MVAGAVTMHGAKILPGVDRLIGYALGLHLATNRGCISLVYARAVRPLALLQVQCRYRQHDNVFRRSPTDRLDVAAYARLDVLMPKEKHVSRGQIAMKTSSLSFSSCHPNFQVASSRVVSISNSTCRNARVRGPRPPGVSNFVKDRKPTSSVTTS